MVSVYYEDGCVLFSKSKLNRIQKILRSVCVVISKLSKRKSKWTGKLLTPSENNVPRERAGGIEFNRGYFKVGQIIMNRVKVDSYSCVLILLSLLCLRQ